MPHSSQLNIKFSQNHFFPGSVVHCCLTARRFWVQSRLGPFCVLHVLAPCSFCTCPCCLWVLPLPTRLRTQVMWTGDSKLSKCEGASLYVYIDFRLIQGCTLPLPHDSWDSFSARYTSVCCGSSESRFVVACMQHQTMIRSGDSWLYYI